MEDEATILAAYETGRGSLRTRARWVKEPQKNGTWNIVVTEIPYQVQKSRLVEQIALLLTEKKLLLLGDIRDESAETIRLVLEPKARTVDPDMLMASLFRATQLESRFALNMNVLDGRTPRVMGVKGNTPLLAGPPAGGAHPPLAVPAGRHRAAAGDTRWLYKSIFESG